MTTVLYPESKELVSVAVTWEYGSVHTHEEIAAIMRVIPKSEKYRRMVSKANKELLDKQKYLKSIPKVGYCVLSPTGYTDEVVRQVAMSKKRAGQAVKIAQMAPVDKMDLTQLGRHRAVTDRASAYFAMTAGATVEMKLLNK